MHGNMVLVLVHFTKMKIEFSEIGTRGPSQANPGQGREQPKPGPGKDDMYDDEDFTLCQKKFNRKKHNIKRITLFD